MHDALRRIEDGAYGKCAACGRQIEAARLEAITWAPYCLEDKEKQEADMLTRTVASTSTRGGTRARITPEGRRTA